MKKSASPTPVGQPTVTCTGILVTEVTTLSVSDELVIVSAKAGMAISPSRAIRRSKENSVKSTACVGDWISDLAFRGKLSRG